MILGKIRERSSLVEVGWGSRDNMLPFSPKLDGLDIQLADLMGDKVKLLPKRMLQQFQDSQPRRLGCKLQRLMPDGKFKPASQLIPYSDYHKWDDRSR
jgi:hypothetical protein